MAFRSSSKQESSRVKGKLLFCCLLVFGLLLVLLVPPLTSPDEVVHFQNAWAIGHGQVWTAEYWSSGKLIIPAGFGPLLGEYPMRLIGSKNQEKCSWADLFRQSLEYTPSDAMMPVEGRIFSFGYLFSAFGMALASAAGSLLGIGWLHSPWIQMLLGRYCNWVFFVLVVRAALRKEQPFRRTLFLLAAMPMSLFLAATLNYDAVLIPVSLFFFASVLSLSEGADKRLSPLSPA